MTQLRSLCIALGLFLVLAWSGVQAEEPASEMEIWLVTYGPGEISWQRFGHNAIWIRDQDLGLNHVFNFGFFDFKQDAFYRRFLQGKLWYFSAAQAAEREFSQYIDENRSIRAQRLNLSAEQSLRLAEYLLSEVQPENRNYLYDYYTNNCSTRIRDALDLALDGALSDSFTAAPAGQNWRDHTRRLTAADFWLYLGLETGLGAPVDRDISRWDEFFIPSELAAAVADLEVPGAGGALPLVLEEAVLYESSLQSPPAEPANWWPAYLLMSLVVLVAGWLASILLNAVTPLGLVRTWLLMAGLAGALLVFLWFFTDHQAARLNSNVLVLNPLWLFLMFWKRTRVAAWAVLSFSLLALMMALVPGGQYNLDVLAAILPLNVVSGLVLLGLMEEPVRRQFQPADRPDVPAAGDR